MTEEVELSNSMRRVLSCVTESGKSEREIATLYLQKYPPDIEIFLKISRAARRKVFSEKKKEPDVPSVQWELDHLVVLGLIEVEPKDFHRGETLEEVTDFYQLSSAGRSLLLAAYQKKSRL